MPCRVLPFAKDVEFISWEQSFSTGSSIASLFYHVIWEVDHYVSGVLMRWYNSAVRSKL